MSPDGTTIQVYSGESSRPSGADENRARFSNNDNYYPILIVRLGRANEGGAFGRAEARSNSVGRPYSAASMDVRVHARNGGRRKGVSRDEIAHKFVSTAQEYIRGGTVLADSAFSSVG